CTSRMQVTILRETLPGEARVALVPEFVKKLIASKVEVHVESGAGAGTFASDADYTAAGASVSSDHQRLLEAADVLLAVNRPPAHDLAQLKKGAVVVGFLKPLDEPAAMEPMVGAGLTAFAMELMPRTTRAQAMDALSSMATIAGYKAVLLAGELLPRIFPMLITAAGTVAPAKVLVLGAGVAGLQAIATAKRLGAVVEAYDVRAAAGEQVKSLGATFLEVDLGGIATEDAGGYARELTPEALKRGRDLIAKQARNADVIVTTAAVPGKPAPLMMDDQAVLAMKRGSVIVDLAASTGGNVSLSRPDEVATTANGVTIFAPLNLAATVPYHASQLFSRNMTSFLQLLRK